MESELIEKSYTGKTNQGLWILILSVLSCWLIQILGAVKEILGGGLPGIYYLWDWCMDGFVCKEENEAGMADKKVSHFFIGFFKS